MRKGSGFLLGKESFPEWPHSNTLYIFFLVLQPKVLVKKHEKHRERFLVKLVLCFECCLWSVVLPTAVPVECFVWFPFLAISSPEHHVGFFQKPHKIFRLNLLVLNSSLSLVSPFLSSETRLGGEAAPETWISQAFEDPPTLVTPRSLGGHGVASPSVCGHKGPDSALESHPVTAWGSPTLLKTSL